jgi:phosphatidate cytidylyltransferase
MTNLQLRTISAIVLGVAVLLVTWLGGAPFRAMTAAIAIAMFFEWSRMSRPAHGPEGGVALIADLSILIFALALVAGFPALTLIALGTALFVGLAVLSAVKVRHHWESAGFAYAALSGLSLAMLRGDDTPGLKAILFLFAVVWATDILAYFVGRAVGGPKLAPAISPGKTRSGAVGGLVAGVVAALLFSVFAGGANIFALCLVAVLLSVVSQAGDLFESWVKRRHGVKDSGWLIPGHGGMMDRVDGLVAAALVLFLIGWLLGSADGPAHGLFTG